jgi:hypothetical protein
MAEEYVEHADAEAETVRIGKRCYVGNLAWKTSWQDLKDKFRECGVVVYANVMRDDEGELLACLARFQLSAAHVIRKTSPRLSEKPDCLFLSQAAQRAGVSWSSRHQRR